MAGTDHLGNDFGNYQNGTKSGTKFEDPNGNGVRDTGEPGIAGVQIHLFGTDGLAERRPPAPDDRRQRELLVLGGAGQLHGVRDGADRARRSPTRPRRRELGGLHGRRHSGLAAGDHAHLGAGRLGQRLRELPTGTKSGTKFDDLNANGIRDAAEPGLAASQIHLFGTDGLGNPVHLHATTAPTARTRSRHRRAATRRARRCRPATRSRSRPRDRAAPGTRGASGHRLGGHADVQRTRLRQRLRELPARHDQWHEVQGR